MLTHTPFLSTGAAIDANAPLQDDFELANGPIDSEEERDAVMAAITRAQPQPVTTETFIFTRSRYQYVRMKEMLHNALGGSRGSGLFATARITTDQPSQPSQQQQQQQQQQQDTSGIGRATATNHEFISVGSRVGSTDLTSPRNTSGFDTSGMTGGTNANGGTTTTVNTGTTTNTTETPSRRTSSTLIPRRESNSNNNNNNSNSNSTNSSNTITTAEVRQMVPMTQPPQPLQPPASSRKSSVSGVAGVAVPA